MLNRTKMTGNRRPQVASITRAAFW